MRSMRTRSLNAHRLKAIAAMTMPMLVAIGCSDSGGSTVSLPDATTVATGSATVAPPCGADEARDSVERLIDAMNIGDAPAADALVARTPRFQWFSVDPERLNADASDRASLGEFLGAQVAVGQQTELISFSFTFYRAEDHITPGTLPSGFLSGVPRPSRQRPPGRVRSNATLVSSWCGQLDRECHRVEPDLPVDRSVDRRRHFGHYALVGNRKGASQRPTSMRSFLLCSAFMMLFASCAGNDEGSTPMSAVDSIQVSVPETTGESGISSAPSASMPRSSRTAPSSEISMVAVTSDCGPTDGNWVRGALTSSDTQSVFAQLSVEGVTYGRSNVVVLEAGVETTVGFDPQRPNEAFGKVGQFEVVHAGTGSVIASSEVLLKIPDGVSCG